MILLSSSDERIAAFRSWQTRCVLDDVHDREVRVIAHQLIRKIGGRFRRCAFSARAPHEDRDVTPVRARIGAARRTNFVEYAARRCHAYSLANCVRSRHALSALCVAGSQVVRFAPQCE